jgi:hypothetical protein
MIVAGPFSVGAKSNESASCLCSSRSTLMFVTFAPSHASNCPVASSETLTAAVAPKAIVAIITIRAIFFILRSPVSISKLISA